MLDDQELRQWSIERYLDFVNTFNVSSESPWLPTKGDFARGADELYRYARDGVVPVKTQPDQPPRS